MMAVQAVHKIFLIPLLTASSYAKQKKVGFSDFSLTNKLNQNLNKN